MLSMKTTSIMCYRGIHGELQCIHNVIYNYTDKHTQGFLMHYIINHKTL